MFARKPLFDIANLAMLLVVVIWAVNNVATKAVLNVRVLPLTYVFLRLSVVVLMLGVWLLLRGRLVRIERQDWTRLMVAAISGYALAGMLFAIGISRTSAFSAAIIAAMGPVFTFLFAALLGIDQVRRVQWAGVLLAFAGVVLFVSAKLAGSTPATGDLLNLLSAACFACYNLAIGPLVQKYGSPVSAFWSVLISLVVITPLAIPALSRQDWQAIGAPGWSAIIYASAISMLVGYLIWGWAIGRRGASRTVPFMFLVPVMTGVLSYIFLDERFSPWQIAGAALIIAGVFLALGGTRRAKRRELSQPAG